jgi:hypothetical protein
MFKLQVQILTKEGLRRAYNTKCCYPFSAPYHQSVGLRREYDSHNKQRLLPKHDNKFVVTLWKGGRNQVFTCNWELILSSSLTAECMSVWNRKVLRPAKSINVFRGLPLSSRKCRVGDQITRCSAHFSCSHHNFKKFPHKCSPPNFIKISSKYSTPNTKLNTNFSFQSAFTSRTSGYCLGKFRAEYYRFLSL